MFGEGAEAAGPESFRTSRFLRSLRSRTGDPRPGTCSEGAAGLPGSGAPAPKGAAGPNLAPSASPPPGLCSSRNGQERKG